MKQLTLDNSKPGSCFLVKKINSTGDIRRRLLDIGLTEGTKIENVLASPFGDPMAFLIRGALIALRNDDAKNIVVEAI